MIIYQFKTVEGLQWLFCQKTAPVSLHYLYWNYIKLCRRWNSKKCNSFSCCFLLLNRSGEHIDQTPQEWENAFLQKLGSVASVSTTRNWPRYPGWTPYWCFSHSPYLSVISSIDIVRRGFFDDHSWHGLRCMKLSSKSIIRTFPFFW